MIIDFHTHTFPEKIAAATVAHLSGQAHIKAYTDATQAGLISSMDRAGITVSVNLPVATAPRQVEHINDTAAAINAAQDRILSFGCMHPDYVNWEAELERLAERGIPGIKIHPVYQGCAIDDAKFVRILKRCGELGIIVVTHAGLDIGFPGVVKCSPKMTRRAVDAAGDVILIAAHMGGWKNWDEVPGYLSDTPVYLDTSFSTGLFSETGEGFYRPEERQMLNEESFMRLVDAFGAERLVFGTDSPWSDQKQAVEWLMAVPLSKDRRRKIFSENACTLLKIREDPDRAIREKDPAHRIQR